MIGVCSQVPMVSSRRVAPVVVCQAAEAEPAVVDTGVKHGVAKQTFQRGSPHKVDRMSFKDCAIMVYTCHELWLVCGGVWARKRGGLTWDRVLDFEAFLCMQVRRILDVIRGRSYEEALMLAEYMPYKACETILKVLMSVSTQLAPLHSSCLISFFMGTGLLLRRQPMPRTTRVPSRPSLLSQSALLMAGHCLSAPARAPRAGGEAGSAMQSMQRLLRKRLAEHDLSNEFLF